MTEPESLPEIENAEVDETLMDIEDQAANAADAAAVNLQKERAKRVQNRTADFWRNILSTPQGRAELWRIFQMGGLFRTPFTATNGFPDANATFFAAGKHAFVQDLYHEALASDLEGVRTMLIEHDSGFKALAPELKRRGVRA